MRVLLAKVFQGGTFEQVKNVYFETPRQVIFYKMRYTRSMTSQSFEHRYNDLGIQMLSLNLFEQIFKSKNTATKTSVEKSIEHLKKHGLGAKRSPKLPDIELKLPELLGNNIEEHFVELGKKYSEPYKVLLDLLIRESLPEKPAEWSYQTGWTRYAKKGGPVRVPFPEEKCIVFDIELCVQEGNHPVLATAASHLYWYSWCSERLIRDKAEFTNSVELDDLISLDPMSQEERIVIGHNVSFDRSFVKEQYLIEVSKLRFLDTLSLHMCVSGLTGVQRAMSVANKSSRNNSKSGFDKAAFMWLDISSLNNLKDVHSLYCPDSKPIQKDPRDIFINGAIADVRRDFQNLMNYCAQDVSATYEVLRKVLPVYFERFPHPISFAGMLEMSIPYLPVNRNWESYLNSTERMYNTLQEELKNFLGQLANDACKMIHNKQYLKDPWLWNLDWSCKALKLNKPLKNSDPNAVKHQDESVNRINETEIEIPPRGDIAIHPKLLNRLPKRRPFMPGYPLWYRELCEKPNGKPDWKLGPTLISTQMRSTPKLMRLTWDGYPLHYDKNFGWGYLVPGRPIMNDDECLFPYEELLKICPMPKTLNTGLPEDFDALISNADKLMGDKAEESILWKKLLDEYLAEEEKYGKQRSLGPFNSVKIRGCHFYKLPHKDGPDNNVGNPLSKDFLSKVADGTLSTYGGGQAERVLIISKMNSYWKNSKKRILSQMKVNLDKRFLPASVQSNENYSEDLKLGAIIPRLIVAGTVTRRAVEPTWLTASNAYVDRVGSELKGMVQCPPGYKFVGADVDSQELWIAAIFGDANFMGIHGCTAFGWMTLQGKKLDGTDMHSWTANSVGISRDQAKVLNYGRIYGAGKAFATRLLMQFNHRLTPEEARLKANKMYSETKGIRKIAPLPIDADADAIFMRDLAFRKKIWTGGSESHMFNKLEEIAESESPTTPILGCRISKALEPAIVDNNFMTSRVNWVVQSSAVDYLHLMLVSMRWIMESYNINGRFAISIHDEVRYLVESQDCYRAALALQITNLLVRSLFAYKLKLQDLPLSVAFFSSVDIDVCLRKEVSMDCKTPSNPDGLNKGYSIPPGESLDIQQILNKTNSGSLQKEST